MPTYTIIAQIKTRNTPTSPATVEQYKMFDRSSLRGAVSAAKSWLRGAMTDEEVGQAVLSAPVAGSQTRYLTWTEVGQ